MGTPVALCPVPRMQFLDAGGTPLAGGLVYTYNAGGSIPAPTYTDSTGTILNTNPVILDAAGEAAIWLANQSYRIVVCDSGNAQQWMADNVSAYQILNQTQNLYLSGVTADPAGTAGEIGYRSDLGRLRFFNTVWDSIPGLNTADILTNKILTAPIVNNPTLNSGSWIGSPQLANPVIAGVNALAGTSYTVLATDEQKLITFSNLSPVAITLPQATTPGFGAGTVFHFRNYGVGPVTITPNVSTIDGNATLVLLTGQGADVYSDGANYSCQLGSAPLASGCAKGVTTIGPVTVTNNNSQQNLLSGVLPANTLSAGSLLVVEAVGVESADTSSTLTVGVTVGGGTMCATASVTVPNGYTNQPWNATFKFFVLTSGATGTMNGSCFISVASPTGVVHAIGTSGNVGTPTISVNTTVPNTIQVVAQMNVADASTSVTQQLLKAVIF
jgi:hypothetical protein